METTGARRPIATAALVLITAGIGAAALARAGAEGWPRLAPERLWQGEWWRIPAGALVATRAPLLLLGALAIAGAGRIYEARRGAAALAAAFLAGGIAGFAAGLARPGAPAGGGLAAGGAAIAAAIALAGPEDRLQAAFWGALALGLGALERALPGAVAGAAAGGVVEVAIRLSRKRRSALGLILVIPAVAIALAVRPRWSESPALGEAVAAVRAGDLARARPALERIVAGFPAAALDPGLIEDAADLARDAGDSRLAMRWYGLAGQAGGGFSPWHKLGMIALDAGGADPRPFEQALAAAPPALDRDLYGRGIEWLRAGRRDLAVAALREAGRRARGEPEG